MNFASDNAGPAAPEIIEAVAKANQSYHMPYGNDAITKVAIEKIREIFEAPAASVHFVATGTAANALALASMANPWDGVFMHRTAHAEEDECGAPEFFTGGAKMVLVDGENGKMDAGSLVAAIETTGDKGVHGVQRGPVSLTNVTEIGSVYSQPELMALCGIARHYGLQTHLDGARLSNAAAATGLSLAELTWKAGIDAVSFGGTKNGCMGVEAIIFFNPPRSNELELRRKRGGHLLSKGRLLSAQMAAYATDNLWLRLAQNANSRAAQLIEGLRTIQGASIEGTPEANMVFASLPRAAHRRAMEAGAQYYLFPFDTSLEGDDDKHIRCRFVCDWACTEEAVSQLLDLLKG